MNTAILFVARIAFGLATAFCFAAALYGVFAFSPVAAPAFVALSTIGICNVPLYLSPILTEGAQNPSHGDRSSSDSRRAA